MTKRFRSAPPIGPLYLSPLGRVCELMPTPEHGPGSDGRTYVFAYVRHNGLRHAQEGFSLSAANMRHMRKVAQG